MAGQRSWDATVGTAVALQWLVVLVLAGATWLLSEKSGWSLFYGGAAVALPNSLLALWLTLRVHRAGGAGAAALMMGELVKLGFTIVLLVVLIGRLKLEMSWWALMVGVVAALKAQWLALWVTRGL